MRTTAKQFRAIWNTSATIEEAAYRLGTTNRKASGRASNFRNHGVKLKKFTSRKYSNQKWTPPYTTKQVPREIDWKEFDNVNVAKTKKQGSNARHYAVFALKTLMLAVSAILLIATAIRVERLF